MSKELTDAWVLEQGRTSKVPGELILKKKELPQLSKENVLVEPIYGCWEGNMHHAIMRNPVDICLQRKEKEIILGNAGVVRVLKIDNSQSHLKSGDFALIFCNAVTDDYGYPKKILGYDAEGTMGIMAKRAILPLTSLIKIPEKSNFSLKQWAAFSLRYITAWSNWKLAYNCWKLQMNGVDTADMFVASWGGGVGFAEILLAKKSGFRTIMIASRKKRLEYLEKQGINALDRSKFPDLNFDPSRYNADKNYQKSYIENEIAFLQAIENITNGKGVAIFIDNIGLKVYRATLKALSRQGVITTSGWKEGMKLSYFRAIESIGRRQHIHTHYARYSEALEAIEYSIANNWIPPMEDNYIYEWEDIMLLHNKYSNNEIDTYFPLYSINKI